jgi:DNA-directed RNA polymerase subunit RPC12/RpoP
MNPDVENQPSSPNPNRYIRCPDCGEQILMMPNLTEMIEAIETHLSTHDAQAKLNPIVAHLKEPVIEESLTEQVLMTAAEIRETPNKNQTWINLP